MITGTTTATGSYPLTLTVSDSSTPAQSASSTVTLEVDATPALSASTTSLPDGAVGQPYQAQLASSGGMGSVTWQLTSGQLPSGLSLDPSGAITGTPTGAGSSTVTFQATDSSATAQTASTTVTLTVDAGPGLSISTAFLPDATSGTAYDETLDAGGGSAPYSWTLTGGALPQGLVLDSSGEIDGTPTGYGTSTFTVTAQDSGTPNPSTATATLTLTVEPQPLAAPTFTAAQPTTPAIVKLSYSYQFQASGNPAPSYTVSSGALPPGLTLANGTGVLSGKPTQTGTFSFSVSATNTISPAATSGKLTIVVIKK